MEFPNPCAEPASVPPLERLPLHVFEYICQYVPRRSLASLALTSRFCATATTPRRFSRIRLTIRDKEKLRDDLQRWNAVLNDGNRFLHVRRLVVVGFMPDGDESEAHLRSYRLSSATDSDGESEGDSDTDGDNDYSRVRMKLWGFVRPDFTETHKRAQHAAWLPFARFLGQLPALKDLVYACTHQVPACLLAALHEHHPQSRLHLRTFCLRSLYQERDQLHGIDPDELTLATSPCLYSIRATCDTYDSAGRFSFNVAAIESMVLGAAPGLRRVHIVHWVPYSTPDPVPAIQASRVLWRDFFPESTSSSVQTNPLARLEALALSGLGSNPYYLSAWNNRTDFSCLLRLEIFCTLSLQALETLAFMAVDSKFRSLQTLGLRVTAQDDENKITTLDKPTSLFLQAIPQLKNLNLYGQFGPLTLHGVLHRHGPTLRKLQLHPAIHVHAPYHNTLAHNVAARCPRLEVLSVQIQRHQGGPEETSAYRALGALPRLRSLALRLDCSVPPYNDKGEMIRATLANHAVDAILARAIFDEVTGAAAGEPLKYLRVTPGVTEIGARDLRMLARWVALEWECLRRPEDGGQVVVRKACMEVDDSTYFTDEMFMFCRPDVLESVDQEYKDMWNEMWPGGGGDWKDEWRSFPLQAQGLDA